MDEIEHQFLTAIRKAESLGDNDLAYDLSLALNQYRLYYKENTSG